MGGGSRMYRLLGNLEVLDGAEPVSLGTAKQRALLTILLLRANHVVPTDVLVDQLWSGNEPASAVTTLHGYIAGLRRALGAYAIRTASPGYVIQLDDGALDITTFEALHAEGRVALADGDWHAAASVLRRALDLWRGPALAEVAEEFFASADAARLEQARLAALDGWARAELALGHHAEIAGALEDALSRAPLREDLRARLVLALYRSGRQAEALRSLSAGRTLLVDEVGIDPGPELVALESAILDQDPALNWSPLPSSPVHQSSASADAASLPGSSPLVDGTVAAEAPPVPVTGAGGGGLLGRDDEIVMLHADLSAAMSAAGRISLLGGEPGIGKTRLAEDVARAGAERGAAVVWGRCYEGRGAPAFWPWAQIVTALLDRFGRDAMIEALGDGAADVALFAPSVSDLVVANAPLPAPDIESGRFRAYESTARLLGALARQRPLVIVVDDLHWGDVASLELLAFVARSIADSRILVVATFRTTDPVVVSPLVETLAAIARTTSRRLDLVGLEIATVATLLRAAHVTDDGDRESSAEIVTDIYRRTHGNPFFVGELVRWLATARGREDPGSVPAAIGEVIRDRVSRLPEAVATALADASILGQHLEADLLGAVVGLEPRALLDRLAPALTAGLLVGDGLRGRWRFSHGLVSETLVVGLDIARRTDLHQRAADALRVRHGDSDGPHLASIAQHMVEAVPAVPRVEVLAALRRAAMWAETHLAHEQAGEQLKTALAIIDDMPMSELRDAEELLVQEQISRLILITVGYGAPELDEALARTRELCARLDDDHELLVPVLWRLCASHTVRTELDIGLDLAKQLLALGEASGDLSRLLVGHMAMGTVNNHSSNFPTARAHFDRAFELCRSGYDSALDNVILETPPVWLLVFSAWNHWALGDAAEAEREVLEAKAAGARLGIGGYAESFAGWFGTLIATLRQDPPTVLQRCETGIDNAIRGGFGLFVPFMSANRGWAVAASGDPAGGIAEITAAEAGIRASGVRMLSHVFPAFLADAHIRAGDFSAAAAEARRGLVAADENTERWYEPELHRLLGTALAAQGDHVAARHHVECAAQIAARHGSTVLLERASTTLAELASAQSDPTR